ncbi:acyl carrier protein [Micromonospora eburnea]|uniref:Phosphopantetheine attachment site n=1 Tax=Micromonospora eburnea TaxID=227316 RepID=A0A1C6V121_9ACTN|nr:acyl carrier protein [Micromonospora eburnea]SCL59999.1 Phosphopantetheine attachment site [Micromonospora eburnea]
MNNIDDFAALLRDEIGLSVTTDDLTRDLDEVTGWDSVHLLTVLMALERAAGRPVPMAAALEAPNLAAIYQLAVDA